MKKYLVLWKSRNEDFRSPFQKSRDIDDDGWHSGSCETLFRAYVFEAGDDKIATRLVNHYLNDRTNDIFSVSFFGCITHGFSVRQVPFKRSRSQKTLSKEEFIIFEALKLDESFVSKLQPLKKLVKD